MEAPAMKIKEILAAEKIEKARKKESIFTGARLISQASGGMEPGEIMAVSAPHAAGKTAFCVSAALFCAVKNNIKTLYLTSSRPANIANRLSGAGAKAPLYIEPVQGVSCEEIDEARPSEMELLFQKYAYEEPAEKVRAMDPVEKHARKIPAWLVIIDSIDYIYEYYPEQGDRAALRSGLLQKAVKEIKRLAEEYNAAVIITVNALETENGAELSREVASCAPLVQYLCRLYWERDRSKRPQKVVFEILKNMRSGKWLISLNDPRQLWELFDPPGKKKKGGEICR
ncbi:hypothetical protein A2625_04005 [candidate division WOR-1 bacterium RIFCSPHIGHO2_01_FULL_53_15]|uniref:SF4 helicase domain-containing protein n=1 Tax=candidate division WOR-1 bacterium RIFCSPHIGHO2_01_FULL_53_15 TaxID=1802564 RepID=A0A1F4Q227_UNCSA|nr:MAG: hypothetical protein A2625_04005 [candidate division WOR-1 bacterium RIFCSPHIGHO2_01_FULL_53_15]OGC12934.1 MAG: hypothetical protein A3D23_05040 [candidate division WOR-1 bacterium RIFCSPHIGHO2_02_FULL_53_26]